MISLSSLYTERDLAMVAETLTSSGQIKSSLVGAFLEDREIREGMLLDDRLFARMMSDQELIIGASPYLFFSVLIMRVRHDLAQKGYTLEIGRRETAAVFDAPRVLELLNLAEIRDYIVILLASFVRIRTTTLSVRVRPGLWRRLRFSDYDVDSLIQYCQLQAESDRFDSYRRVGDVCLFLTGIFPETRAPYRAVGFAAATPMSRTDLGRMFYQLAAGHKAAQMSGVLNSLAENFELATKPLTVLARGYLSSFKEPFFTPA